MKLIITNKVNGVQSITPFVEEIATDGDGLIVYTVLPTRTDDEPHAEFIKWDDRLTYELRKG